MWCQRVLSSREANWRFLWENFLTLCSFSFLHLWMWFQHNIAEAWKQFLLPDNRGRSSRQYRRKGSDWHKVAGCTVQKKKHSLLQITKKFLCNSGLGCQSWRFGYFEIYHQLQICQTRKSAVMEGLLYNVGHSSLSFLICSLCISDIMCSWHWVTILQTQGGSNQLVLSHQ